MTPAWIVLHCSAGDAPPDIDWTDSEVGGLRRYHRSLDWRDIGYHYVVPADGRVQTGRRPDVAGAHVRGLNGSSIGVCMVGSFEESLPPARQWLSTLDLLASLAVTYGLRSDRVIGHREAGPLVGYVVRKTCPGMAIDMGSVRAEVRRRMARMV